MPNDSLPGAGQRTTRQALGAAADLCAGMVKSSRHPSPAGDAVDKMSMLKSGTVGKEVTAQRSKFGSHAPVIVVTAS